MKSTRTPNLARGLSSLMMQETCRYFKHLDDCGHYNNPLSSYPFASGMPIPARGSYIPKRLVFVGATHPDMSVEVFLSHIRFYAGYTEDSKPFKLRVISMPFPNGKPDQNYVFFEIGMPSETAISGETTDFSGAGNAAREELEDVFAVLARVYGIEIERIQLTQSIPLSRLYDKETEMA